MLYTYTDVLRAKKEVNNYLFDNKKRANAKLVEIRIISQVNNPEAKFILNEGVLIDYSTPFVLASANHNEEIDINQWNISTIANDDLVNLIIFRVYTYS